MQLIYCADGNARLAKIAVDNGFLYGLQLPNKPVYEPFFADQNWKRPNREKYMAALSAHRPHMATVLDWEKREQLGEVLSWAEEAAQYVEVVVIIPKVQGGIKSIPKFINQKPVRLGYSIPTSYGGTSLSYDQFLGRGVHLLGGNPHKQLSLRKYLAVESADINYHSHMATRHNKFWQHGKWVELNSYGGHVAHDAPYFAFELSCQNIHEAWYAPKKGTLL